MTNLFISILLYTNNAELPPTILLKTTNSLPNSLYCMQTAEVLPEQTNWVNSWYFFGGGTTYFADSCTNGAKFYRAVYIGPVTW